MRCELVRSHGGWYLQHETNGKPCCITMHATTEADAISEAHDHGFSEFAVFYEVKRDDRTILRHTKDVTIPKPPFP